MSRQSTCGEEDKPPPIPARQPVVQALEPHGASTSVSTSSRPNTPMPTPNRRSKPVFPRTKSQGSAVGPDVKPFRVNLPRQTVSIRTLTELYANYFPSRVIVDKQLGPVLLPNDMLDVHFVKKRLTMRVTARNLNYILPLKAPIKAGILYEGYNNSLCRTVFETVADLIAASPVPKVVCSRRRWGGNGSGSGAVAEGVAVGEVLSLLDVAGQGEQKMLRVYSYMLKSAKLLPMNCVGSFTLCPNEIKLSFSDLLDNAGVSFPWSVAMFPDVSAPLRYPRELMEEVVAITGCVETVSIVCTRYTPDSNGTDVIELPVDTPLEVKCVCLSEAHTQALKAHSSEVVRHYDEASVTYLTGEWVESATPKGGCASANTAAVDSLLCEECYQAVSRDKPGTPPRRASARNTRDEKPSVRTPDLSSLVQRYDLISKDVALIRETLKSIQSQVTTLTSARKGKGTSVNETEESNRRFLRELKVEQVLEVLEAMHLNQYKEVFSEKEVDGMVFAELNESLMEHELGIKSKLHRIRLLSVAKGKRKMSQDRNPQYESCNDDIIPIEGDGIDLSALTHSGFFSCHAFDSQQSGNSNVMAPQDKGTTLRSIALDYASRLPQRIKVLKGIYSDDDETSFSAGDIYDIHFIRMLKTLTLRSVAGHEYQVSCDSVMRVATVFGGTTSAVSFARVANVVAANPMPKVLCTCKSYLGSSPATSVEENEIIAVLSVTFFKGYKYLLVYSFTNKCEKRLPLICNGEFTTHPARIHVPLHELLEHVKDLTMSHVKFFPEKKGAEILPQAFFNETFIITDFGITTVLVGVPYSEQEECCIVVEFSTDLKADILLLPINQDDYSAKTASLIEEYDKKRVHYFRLENDDLKQGQPTIEPDVAMDAVGFDDTELMHRLLSKCDTLEEVIFVIREEANKLSDQVVDMMECAHWSRGDNAPSQLQNMTHEQVLELLNAAGLSQYKHHFANEMIDGMVLAEMDEDMWMIDLGIHSKSDWLKLKRAMAEK